MGRYQYDKVLLILLNLAARTCYGHGAASTTWSFVDSGNGDLRLETLDLASWLSTSRLDCVRVCASKHTSCHSVRFDDVTKSCTPGYYVIKSATSATPSNPLGGSLFTKNGIICDETIGYQFITSNDVAVCLYLSKTQMTYPDAKNACEDRKGTMYAPKSEEKFQILQKIAPMETWVGLEDVNGDENFYWVDGEPFLRGTDFWDLVWGMFDPNRTPGENCVLYGLVIVKKLHDYPCSKECRYVCEIVY